MMKNELVLLESYKETNWANNHILDFPNFNCLGFLGSNKLQGY